MKVPLKILAASICLFVLLVAGCGSPHATIPPTSLAEKSTPPSIPEAETVEFCDLVSTPQLYDKKIVRTRAIVARMTFEVALLYHPQCTHPNKMMDYEYDNEHAANVVSPFMPVGRDDLGRANITVVGRFDGPNEEGYGHLNSFRFHFDIMAVENAEPVPSDVPWPWEFKK